MTTRTYLATGAACAVTAAVGGVAGGGADSRWYRRLDKPAFQPPPQIFPIVWTALYADIAACTAQALDRLAADGRTDEAAALRRALAVNLVLNGSWTWVFFRWHRLAASVGVAAALAGSSADLTRRVGSASPVAGVTLLPYAAWCGFATVLSGSIWRRNRNAR
ncbi:MAG: TspO/MBR family protein [Jatrophihabitans sp.]